MFFPDDICTSLLFIIDSWIKSDYVQAMDQYNNGPSA
jgi:hypothetical protein